MSTGSVSGVSSAVAGATAGVADAGLEQGQAYLVRGANLFCNCGSHVRKLNLPKCHGVYITEHPMIHKLDRIPGDAFNIPSFGVCTAPSSNLIDPKETVTYKLRNYDEQGNQIDIEEDFGVVTGVKCRPIITQPWIDTHVITRVVDNGDKDPFDKHKSHHSSNKGYDAVTTASFLFCDCGGFIEPLTSGQEPEEVVHEIPERR